MKRVAKLFRVKMPLNGVARAILGVTGIVVLLMGYGCLSYRQHRFNPSDTTIPNFGQLVDGAKFVIVPEKNPLKEEPENLGFHDSRLYRDAYATYGRLFKGLMWGCFLSIILGVLMGCYEWIAAPLLPPLSLLAKTPGTAMMAVFFVLVGTGEPMFIAMIGFGILPTLTQDIYLSVRDDVKIEEVQIGYTLGASNMEVIWNIIFQKVLPRIIENVRLQIGPAMVFLIAAEMLVGEVGMGYEIRVQQRLQRMNIVYGYLVLLGCTGLLMDRGMSFLRKKLCRWYKKNGR